jgi:hypothetical protein
VLLIKISLSEHEENIYNLFWGCNIITRFWSEFEICINTFTNTRLTAELVFYGTDDNLLNTLIILAKRSIHDCRNKAVAPDFQKAVRGAISKQCIEW